MCGKPPKLTVLAKRSRHVVKVRSHPAVALKVSPTTTGTPIGRAMATRDTAEEALQPEPDVAVIHRNDDVALVRHHVIGGRQRIAAIAEEIALHQGLLFAEVGRDEGQLAKARAGRDAIGGFEHRGHDGVGAACACHGNTPVVVGSVERIGRRIDGEDREIGKASGQGAERFDIVRHRRFGFDPVAKPAERPVRHDRRADRP